jgi:superoxide dismutase
MPGYRFPDLTCDYTALEPAVSGQIMELHHGFVSGDELDGPR